MKNKLRAIYYVLLLVAVLISCTGCFEHDTTEAKNGLYSNTKGDLFCIVHDDTITVSRKNNANAVTENKDRSRSTIKDSVSIPRELMPESVVTAGVKYEFAKGSPNALICKGQTLSFEEGYDSVSFLITSLDGDRVLLLISSIITSAVIIDTNFK